MSQAEQDKPKYGQYQQPEYGAMSGQYGPNYNPYIYGAPEPDTKKDSAAAAGDNGGAAQSQQAGQPYGQQPAWPGNQQAGGWPYAQGGQQSGPGAYPGGYPGMQGQPYGQQPNGQPHQPHYYHGIDLNDPNQNPLYGHWDSYAIISFILALFFPVPVLSALMGAVAMWRTRTFHMKGFGLAVAAVVINVLYTIAVIWIAFNGYDAMSLYQEALQQLTGGTGSSSDSISA